MFPAHLERILDAYGVPADTKAALYDLYVALGDEVLEVFGDIAEGVSSATLLRPEDTASIRARVVERYLRRNHPQWLEGAPTPSLWHPRELEGRASGLATPLGEVSAQARAIIGENQPVPDGVLMLGRNAHYGGRQDTISFDVLPGHLEDAVAVGHAEGQQHTLPGSVGATSGTFDATHRLALLWEIQPNVYKPAGERNRAIAKIYRRHRNWHIATLVAAIEWLQARSVGIYILRGAALAAAHEVNPEKPVSATIAAHHDRTIAQVLDALGLHLVDPSDHDELLLLEATVMNHALRRHVLREGSVGSIWRVGGLSLQ